MVQRLGFALACAVCACMPVPALAAARPNNAAATHVYLQIVRDTRRVESVNVGASVAAIQALERHIAGECSEALAYAPRDVAYEEIGAEVEYMLSIVFDDRLVPVAQTLGDARELAALSWSNHRLTQLVRDQAAEERAFATHAPPNLCAQIAAWRESSYTALPASSTRFLAEMRASESEVSIGLHEESREKVIDRLLKPYERPSERRLATSILDLGKRVEAHLNAATKSAETQLAAALGVAVL